MLLYNERRGSDVGKQYALSEGHLKDVTDVAPVAQDDTETTKRISPLLRRTLVAGQRFPKMATTSQ